MKLNKQCKIHKAAACDRGRYAMDQVKLEIDADGKSRLVATDGRMLAVVPVTETQEDSAGFVSPDAIAEAIRGAPDEEVAISANGVVRFKVKRGMLEVDRLLEDKGNEFPRWQQVVPKGDVVHRIVLNPQYLMAVAEAIGSTNSVVLEYRQEGAPLVIRPGHSVDGGIGSLTLEDFESRFGLVMPISVDAVVPDGAQLTAGQKAAATRKRNAEARAAEVA